MKNPKITNPHDEILNDISENQPKKEKPIVIQASLPVPTKGPKVILQVIVMVNELPFRTKWVIIGYSGGGWGGGGWGGGGEADESSENNMWINGRFRL